MISYPEFVSRIEVFCQLFNRQLSDRTLREYYKTISIVTDAEFLAIYETLLAESEFFPVPATFLKAAKKRSQDDALAIWERAKNWIIGGYLDSDRIKAMRSDLGKPVMKIIGDIGGIYRILNATDSEIVTIQKEFIRAYGEELIQINLQTALPPS